MRKAAVPLEAVRKIVAECGKLESVERRDPLRVRFEHATLAVLVERTPDGKIAGLFYREAREPVAAGYRIKTRLSLPFRGAWTVGNGGRDPARNNHIGNPQQEYAYDFVREDALGQDVLAPAGGVIAQVIDGVKDNPVGERDLYFVPGNSVVIDHGNGEYTFLAHFKRASIRVKVGQKVARGDVLGLCGNTGNTSEPHIHFHLGDAPEWHKARGLPAPFAGVVVDGKKVAAAEPERGQRVENDEGK